MSQIFRPYGATHERLGEKNMFFPVLILVTLPLYLKINGQRPPVKKEWNLYLKLKWVAVSTDGQVSIEQVLRRHEIIEWLWQLRVLIVCELVGPKNVPQDSGGRFNLLGKSKWISTWFTVVAVLFYPEKNILIEKEERLSLFSHISTKPGRARQKEKCYNRRRSCIKEMSLSFTYITYIACMFLYIYIRLAHICVRLVYNLKKRGSSFITFYYYSSI